MSNSYTCKTCYRKTNLEIISQLSSSFPTGYLILLFTFLNTITPCCKFFIFIQIAPKTNYAIACMHIQEYVSIIFCNAIYVYKLFVRVNWKL